MPEPDQPQHRDGLNWPHPTTNPTTVASKEHHRPSPTTPPRPVTPTYPTITLESVDRGLDLIDGRIGVG
jgi:hypothetical protein